MHSGWWIFKLVVVIVIASWIILSYPEKEDEQ